MTLCRAENEEFTQHFLQPERGASCAKAGCRRPPSDAIVRQNRRTEPVWRRLLLHRLTPGPWDADRFRTTDKHRFMKRDTPLSSIALASNPLRTDTINTDPT